MKIKTVKAMHKNSSPDGWINEGREGEMAGRDTNRHEDICWNGESMH